LDIRVRPGASNGAYTQLSPRQELTSAPYCSFALAAAPGSVLTAPDGSPAQALVVDNNGSVTIFAGTDVSPTGGGGPTVSDLAGTNIGVDGNEIMARNNGSVATLALNADGGNVSVNQNGDGGLVVGADAPILDSRLSVLDSNGGYAIYASNN